VAEWYQWMVNLSQMLSAHLSVDRGQLPQTYHRRRHSKYYNSTSLKTQSTNVHWLLVKVLRSTQHKIGHFGDIPPSQSVGLVQKKQNLTQQKHTFTNQKKFTATQNKTQKN